MTKHTKRALVSSALALLLCFTMLLGTTYAWFTDSVTTVNNKIVAGNLDIELHSAKQPATGTVLNWTTVDASTNIFEENTLWEPGHVEVAYLKVTNAGTLALKWDLTINIVNEVTSKSVLGNDLKLSNYLKAQLVPVTEAYANRAAAKAAVSNGYGLTEYIAGDDLMESRETATYALIVYMPEEVGNEANYAKGAAVPRIDMGITLLATQTPFENDSFGKDYDAGATYPVASNEEFEDAIADITNNNSNVDSAVISLAPGTYDTNFSVAGGKDVVIEGKGKETVMNGQIATTSSNEGTIILRNLTINVSSAIQDSTGISQTSKSAIAIWGNQKVICENVIFNMDLADSTAITSWWDTGVGTSIVARNCTFNCNGNRPIRATGNVTVENCTFNDPYRYAVQLTAKASTATELDKAIINFNNNTIVNGENGKAFVYGVQLEGADYGCNNCVINGAGNTIVNGGADSTMYYCECGKVDHATIEWNVEVAPVHEN